MTESLLAMAKDLALAQIQAGHVAPDEMTSILNATYEILQQLSATEQTESQTPVSTTLTNWKKSITKYAVTCLECGASFRQLSTRHLRLHGLDGRTYRQKYGIPRTQSLSARDVQATRLAIIQRVKPWEKSPTNQKAQAKAMDKTRPATSQKAPKKSRKTATAKRGKSLTSA
jgi:predicted transcriptional regulator